LCEKDYIQDGMRCQACMIILHDYSFGFDNY
jgi:hypothetical protein